MTATARSSNISRRCATRCSICESAEFGKLSQTIRRSFVTSSMYCLHLNSAQQDSISLKNNATQQRNNTYGWRTHISKYQEYKTPTDTWERTYFISNVCQLHRCDKMNPLHYCLATHCCLHQIYKFTTYKFLNNSLLEINR